VLITSLSYNKDKEGEGEERRRPFRSVARAEVSWQGSAMLQNWRRLVLWLLLLGEKKL
jgi:hypothetical protein